MIATMTAPKPPTPITTKLYIDRPGLLDVVFVDGGMLVDVGVIIVDEGGVVVVVVNNVVDDIVVSILIDVIQVGSGVNPFGW